MVGPDNLRIMLGFVNGELDISVLNETFFVLIPKIKRPMKVTKYCPISLCNMVYKLISKPLTHRLGGVLPDLINSHKVLL